MNPLPEGNERTALVRRIKWLLFLRVVILSFFLGAVAVVSFVRGAPEDSEAFRGLQVPVIGAYGISLVSALLLGRVRNLRFFSHLQVNFDVLLITGIVWITGGLESPFPFLYNLAVMNGSVLLFHRGAFTTAIFSSVCYGALALWEWSHQSTGASATGALIMNSMLNIPSFFLIAFLGGVLARRLHQTELLLEQKQKEYHDLEALKDAVLEGVASGIAVTDLKGYVNYFNAQARALTSLGEDAVKGKKLAEVLPGLSYEFNGDHEPRRMVLQEFEFVDPQGRSKQLRLTLAPLSDKQERPLGYVAIFDDVTKQKELEEKVRLEEEMRRARARSLEPKEGGEGTQGEFRFHGVVGKSGGMDKIYQLIQKIAAATTNVLITGESGTGKELVARAIHDNGPRKNGPFVAVNCGAIPENLIESELFGHVRGAFTGAVADHEGLFKRADKGTIFLDEVGELPLHLQVKLLRVLQEKTFTPVGSSKPVRVDVRVISASNRDLRKEVEKGRFREDLFYRLNVVHIALPPLRDRREDIPLLCHYFMEKFAASQNKKVEEISSDSLVHLMNHSYPGNVRELENIIEHAVAITAKNIITEEDLPAYIKGTPIAKEVELFERTAPGGPEIFFTKNISLDDEIATHEKCLLIGALKRTNGVQKKAAELLGINYRSFRHRLEKYGLVNVRQYGVVEEEEKSTP
ncbi:MAG TPA: sigma 54-interacting transcriptional regulator [Candidatus Acidoferrales bacterium]|nr:sigma 54-interacting transcriptional regulator [Candidatus Acidoferrales bacterium]